MPGSLDTRGSATDKPPPSAVGDQGVISPAVLASLTKERKPIFGLIKSHRSVAPEILKRMVRIVLYQPDIAQNTGTILRLAACFGLEAHIIEPAGFPVSDRAFRRAGMDYLDHVDIRRHESWAAFEAWRIEKTCRAILFTTRASGSYLDFAFADGDALVFGRESAGVPDSVHDAADAKVSIPIRAPLRSLNVAMSAALGVGEALRQLR